MILDDARTLHCTALLLYSALHAHRVGRSFASPAENSTAKSVQCEAISSAQGDDEK